LILFLLRFAPFLVLCPALFVPLSGIVQTLGCEHAKVLRYYPRSSAASMAIAEVSADASPRLKVPRSRPFAAAV